MCLICQLNFPSNSAFSLFWHKVHINNVVCVCMYMHVHVCAWVCVHGGVCVCGCVCVCV